MARLPERGQNGFQQLEITWKGQNSNSSPGKLHFFLKTSTAFRKKSGVSFYLPARQSCKFFYASSGALATETLGLDIQLPEHLKLVLQRLRKSLAILCQRHRGGHCDADSWTAIRSSHLLFR